MRLATENTQNLQEISLNTSHAEIHRPLQPFGKSPLLKNICLLAGVVLFLKYIK